MVWSWGHGPPWFSGQSGFDQAYLHEVKTGFSALSGPYNREEVLVLIGLLVAVILLILLLYLHFRPAARHLVRGNRDIIQDPRKIREILERSVTLRAVYDIEIFDEKYRQIYRGSVLGINPEGDLEIEFGSFIDPSLDFVNKPLRAGFRMSRRGEQEFYQFNSMSKFYGVSRDFGRREKSIRIHVPGVIERSQKRRFVRVEPAGRFRFKVRLMDSKKKTEPIPTLMFYPLCEAEVMDISLGGVQVLVEGRPKDLGIEVGQELLLNFKPPALETEDWLPRKVLAKARILSIQAINEDRPPSIGEDGKAQVFHQVRLEFLARGILNPAERTLSFRSAKALVFEDLSRWIQAYQRQEIQEQKGTRSKPDLVPNLFGPRSPDDDAPRSGSETHGTATEGMESPGGEPAEPPIEIDEP